ncbi:RPM1-interacting protein 4-like [Actinidia eriantha]|uniref:RPM1-interacting protein 4-like n=1 Tax=Actinidia eriantha TaxID=165200 RepID=UPI002585063F|nr:RPM1-interacting protein 4-like [Actinidia eriantha]
MAQSSQVPTFGNWESEENYTEYFDNKRKKKGGGRLNPNDHQVNTPLVLALPLKQEAELKGQKRPAATRPKHDFQTSHEDGQLRRVTDSPLHHESEASKEVSRPRHERQLSREEGELTRPIDSPYQRHGGPSTDEAPKRVTRPNAGSDCSVDKSPLHPHYQARMGGKVGGVSSPSWERKVSSEGSHASSTPGRSRLRSVTRGNDTPDNGHAVPKFGDWDESDPTSAEGYSQIFNKVREEKQSEAGKVPAMATETSYSNGQKQYRNDNPKSCFCFPWGGK